MLVNPNIEPVVWWNAFVVISAVIIPHFPPERVEIRTVKIGHNELSYRFSVGHSSGVNPAQRQCITFANVLLKENVDLMPLVVFGIKWFPTSKLRKLVYNISVRVCYPSLKAFQVESCHQVHSKTFSLPLIEHLPEHIGKIGFVAKNIADTLVVCIHRYRNAGNVLGFDVKNRMVSPHRLYSLVRHYPCVKKRYPHFLEFRNRHYKLVIPPKRNFCSRFFIDSPLN